jgi:hypothetical protein
MQPSILEDASRSPRGAALRSAARTAPLGAGASRAMLVVGCALTLILAARLGRPAAYLAADPALARLLRGMAVIKGAAVLAAFAAVFWRLGWRASLGSAAAYLTTTWLLAGSTMLIWQLTWIPAAAVLFHGALIAILVAAWRDDLGKRVRMRAARAVRGSQ